MRCFVRMTALVRMVAVALLCACPALAQQLSSGVEALRVENVGDGWQAVDFLNSYASAVVVCTYNLPSRSSPPAIPRVRNVSATGMELRAQVWSPAGAATPSTVHCLVADEGTHTLSQNQTLEARRIDAPNTTGLATNWNVNDFVNAAPLFTALPGDMVVLGGLMTANDAQPSAFIARATSRLDRPTPAVFLVAKHIGQISGTRAAETLGVIVTSPGSGTANDVGYSFGVTPNTVQGVGTNTPPWSTAVAGDFDTGVATVNAMNGNQGGFAVLFGADPLPANRLDLAIDEETVAGDTSRSHIEEEVAFALFDDNQTEQLSATKTLSTPPGGFNIPGADVLYTLAVQNTGSAPLARDGLFISDPLPAEVDLFTGDLAGPGSGPVLFDAGGTGLTLDPQTDIAYSVGAPAGFAACTAAPTNPALTHLCLRPGGRLGAGTLQPGTATFTFQARIK